MKTKMDTLKSYDRKCKMVSALFSLLFVYDSKQEESSKSLIFYGCMKLLASHFFDVSTLPGKIRLS